MFLCLVLVHHLEGVHKVVVLFIPFFLVLGVLFFLLAVVGTYDSGRIVGQCKLIAVFLFGEADLAVFDLLAEVFVFFVVSDNVARVPRDLECRRFVAAEKLLLLVFNRLFKLFFVHEVAVRLLRELNGAVSDIVYRRCVYKCIKLVELLVLAFAVVVISDKVLVLFHQRGKRFAQTVRACARVCIGLHTLGIFSDDFVLLRNSRIAVGDRFGRRGRDFRVLHGFGLGRRKAGLFIYKTLVFYVCFFKQLAETRLLFLHI